MIAADGTANFPDENTGTPRKIVHIDMDAFFASVEQRDNPALKGLPIAVGGSRERGVVAAASYEARVFGVHSAMPSITAKRKCPDLIFVKPRFEVYKSVSQQVQAIFAEYTSLVEPLSLDEAYLDVTENLAGLALATDVARRVRQKIKDVTGLTASAGISYNKFLAKMASGQKKPDGQFVIAPGRGEAFVESLPIGKFHGVGPATAERMQRLGIATGADLRQHPLEFLQQHFGKSGAYFYDIARGIDHRIVQPDRIRKSIGAENTFSMDIHTLGEAVSALQPIVDKVILHCETKNIRGRTITLKVKYADFVQITRSRSLPFPINDRDSVTQQAHDLLEAVFPITKGIRLLGVTLSSLEGMAENSQDQMMLEM